MTIRPAFSPPGTSPRRTRLVEALLIVCAGAAMLAACGSDEQGRDDYFTIQLFPSAPIIGPTSGTYYYIPVTGTSYRTDPQFAPCGVVEVSFSGIALASAGGVSSRVPDGAEQETETSVRYLGNSDFSLCNSAQDVTFQAEFTYQGGRYVVEGEVALPFGNYPAIVPGTNWDDTCSQYAFDLRENEATSGYLACFWPYEYGPPASAAYAQRPVQH